MRHVRKPIEKYVKTHPEYRHLKTILGIMMKRYGLSLRRIVELHFRKGSRKAATSSIFCHAHKWLGRLSTELPDDLILFTAGRAAYGAFSADASHHRFRCTLVEYTKKTRVKRTSLLRKNGWPTHASTMP